MRPRRVASGALLAAWSGLALVSALVPALVPAAAEARTADRPVQKVLANGLEVVVFEDPRLPVVSCRLVVRAGSAHEAPAQAGLAALTARALLLGTDTTDAVGLRRALEAAGAEMSASASYDYSLATLSAPGGHAPRYLALFGQVVSRPAFPEAEWGALRARAADEARQAGLDPRRAADRHLAALLFGSAAYGRPIEGDAISISALLAGDARRFHEAFWLPNNAILAVAGDVRAAEVLPLVERAFGGWRRGTVGPRAPVPPAPGQSAVRVLDAPDVARVSLRLGVEGPGRSDPDQLAAAALHVLFGGRRRDSRVSRALAERGAGEVEVATNWSFEARAGGLVLAAEAPPERVRAVVDAYREAVSELGRAPVSSQEMELARRVLLGAALIAQEPPAERAERWLLAKVYGQGEDYMSTYADRVRALEPADLQRVARRYLSSDSLAVVAVGPREALQSQLADLGPPRVLPLGARSGAVPAVAIPLPASPTRDTPEARERGRAVVVSALEAHGGLAALERAASWRASGTLSIGLEERQSIGPYAEVFAWPDRWRLEMVIDGSPVARTLDGETGWSASAGSVSHLEPETVAGLQLTRYGLPIVLLRQLGSPSARLLSVGRETRDGRPVDVVDWLREDGGYTRVYFDATSHLLAAAEQLERAQEGGAPIQVLRLYDDERPVEGIVHPFTTVLYARHVRASEHRMESLEIGVPVGEATFRPPAR